MSYAATLAKAAIAVAKAEHVAKTRQEDLGYIEDLSYDSLEESYRKAEFELIRRCDRAHQAVLRAEENLRLFREAREVRFCKPQNDLLPQSVTVNQQELDELNKRFDVFKEDERQNFAELIDEYNDDAKI